MAKGEHMTMQTLRVPIGKRRPHFASDVPPQVQRLVWIKWLRAQAASERPYMPISSRGATELADLLESHDA